MKTILDKYAHLLVNYCVDIQKGDRLYVKSTTLAEPLIREVYRHALRAGALVEVDLDIQGQSHIFFNEATGEQLEYVPMLYQKAMHEFDAFIMIRAPFNLKESHGNHSDKIKVWQNARKASNQKYFERTATRELKRCTCQYPTLANAQEAGLPLEVYEHFVFNACKLFDENPIESWLEVRRSQQNIVDKLNSCEKIHYKGKDIDIAFSTKGRTWINSDGQTNMPSGEVYTSPVENSVNGIIRFSFPALYMGHELEDVTLWVKDGWIEKWEATRGKAFLDYIFQIDGARRFGEAAIGTNYSINLFTKNILFDEKIGGTVHMAIGQSYLQAGGQNKSSIHWDMITDMKDGGEIFADDEKIYENGSFLI